MRIPIATQPFQVWRGFQTTRGHLQHSSVPNVENVTSVMLLRSISLLRENIFAPVVHRFFIELCLFKLRGLRTQIWPLPRSLDVGGCGDLATGNLMRKIALGSGLGG